MKVAAHDDIRLPIQSASQNHLILWIVRVTSGDIGVSCYQLSVMFQECNRLFNIIIAEMIFLWMRGYRMTARTSATIADELGNRNRRSRQAFNTSAGAPLRLKMPLTITFVSITTHSMVANQTLPVL